MEKGSKKRINWTEEEVLHFLSILKEKRIIELMDGKRFKAAEVFKALVPEMAKANFIKTPEAMKIKLKNLKGK